MPLLTTAILFAVTTQAGGLKLLPPKVVLGVRPVALAASPSGSRFVATMEDGSVRIIDAATGATVRNLAKHPQAAYAVAWSADGAVIATGDETARIYVEDARTGAKIKEYRTHTKGIEKLSINSIRDRLLSTGKDDFIKVYDLNSSATKEAVSIPGKGANFYGATFCPNLPYTFATGLLIHGGRLYDAKTGKVVSFLVDNADQGTLDVAYHPEGTRIVTTGRDGKSAMWDAKTYKKLGNLNGVQDLVMYAAFSPNGRYIATSSTDRTIKIRNTFSLAPAAEIQSQNPVGSPLAFTADGKYLLTVNDAGFLQVNPLSPAQPGSAYVGLHMPKETKHKKVRRHR